MIILLVNIVKAWISLEVHITYQPSTVLGNKLFIILIWKIISWKIILLVNIVKAGISLEVNITYKPSNVLGELKAFISPNSTPRE